MCVTFSTELSRLREISADNSFVRITRRELHGTNSRDRSMRRSRAWRKKSAERDRERNSTIVIVPQRDGTRRVALFPGVIGAQMRIGDQ